MCAQSSIDVDEANPGVKQRAWFANGCLPIGWNQVDSQPFSPSCCIPAVVAAPDNETDIDSDNSTVIDECVFTPGGACVVLEFRGRFLVNDSAVDDDGGDDNGDDDGTNVINPDNSTVVNIDLLVHQLALAIEYEGLCPANITLQLIRVGKPMQNLGTNTFSVHVQLLNPATFGQTFTVDVFMATIVIVVAKANFLEEYQDQLLAVASYRSYADDQVTFQAMSENGAAGAAPLPWLVASTLVISVVAHAVGLV
jgi:hypothetical protein